MKCQDLFSLKKKKQKKNAKTHTHTHKKMAPAVNFAGCLKGQAFFFLFSNGAFVSINTT